jgi:GT2 family glycosyltransferase
MSAGVSIIVPALRPCEQLQRCMASLDAALSLRSGRDELILVDDSGCGAVAEWARRSAAFAQLVGTGQNLGFQGAIAAGLAAARHELVFLANSDLTVRPGFLEPLVAALAEHDVFAAVPRVLRGGAPEHVESLVRIEPADGKLLVTQPCVGDTRREPPRSALEETRPVPFALGGACLIRRAELLDGRGFDPLFEPFYLEDVDLGWRAWRSGRRCVHVPESIVEHTNQGTIGAVAPRELALDAIEKNLLLFQWKHLDGDALVEHLDQLERRALDAWLGGQRRDLEVLALALEQVEAALAARARLPEAVSSFTELARRSDPFGA